MLPEGGKSAPEVIEQFGGKARQNDKLHAKVIWTPSKAIVGSANASSNGLPEDEEQVDGLIEAGVYLDGAEELASIETWFDKLYEDAQPITETDLKAAEEARVGWGRRPKPELVDIPINELKKMPIAVLLWSARMTAQENREVEKLEEPLLKFKNVDWYGDTLGHARKYPYEYETISFETYLDRTKLSSNFYLQKFPLQTDWWKIKTKSKLDRVIFAEYLEKTDALRSYKIGEASIRRIRALLQNRELKLGCYLDSGREEVFLSWEPEPSGVGLRWGFFVFASRFFSCGFKFAVSRKVHPALAYILSVVGNMPCQVAPTFFVFICVASWSPSRRHR